MAASGFLVQYTLQDVFALACWKVAEEILRRHLDEPEQEAVAVERTGLKRGLHPFAFFLLSIPYFIY